MNNNKDNNIKCQEAWQQMLGKHQCDYFSSTLIETPLKEIYIKRIFDNFYKKLPITHHVWVQQYTPERLPIILSAFIIKDKEMLTKENLKEMLEKYGPTQIWDVNSDIQQDIFKLMFEQYPMCDNIGLIGDY